MESAGGDCGLSFKKSLWLFRFKLIIDCLIIFTFINHYVFRSFDSSKT
jgi:hypothetical protein